MGALGIVVALVTGWLVVRLLEPERGLRPRWLARVYEAALGTGAGLAVTGVLFFLLRAVGLASRGAVIAADFLLLAALVGLSVRLPLRPEAEGTGQSRPPTWRWNKLLALALAVAMLTALAMQLGTIKASPFGEWDAFSIWNLRAKFLAGPDGAWLHAFSPLLEETHPEYPPLLSAFVARAWTWGGSNGTTLEPLMVAMIVYWSAFALLASSLAIARAPALGLLACFAFLATGSYLRQSTWQYADIPLGYLILATVSLLTLAGRRPQTLALAGGFAAAAALVKDEGLPFLLLVFLCTIGVTLRRESTEALVPRLRWMAVGALPGVLLLAAFKLFLAPDIGGVLRGQTFGQVMEKLVDPARYGLILEGSFSRFVALGNGVSHPAVLLAILAIVLRFAWTERTKTPLIGATLTLALMIVTYWGVYLVTPDDLVWRIDTSLHRLYTQVWPSILFVFFMLLGMPEDPLVPVAEPKPEKLSKKARKRRPALAGSFRLAAKGQRGPA